MAMVQLTMKSPFEPKIAAFRATATFALFGGSGCGAVGRAVATAVRIHSPAILFSSCNCTENLKIKKKEAGKGATL